MRLHKNGRAIAQFTTIAQVCAATAALRRSREPRHAFGTTEQTRDRAAAAHRRCEMDNYFACIAGEQLMMQLRNLPTERGRAAVELNGANAPLDFVAGGPLRQRWGAIGFEAGE